MKAYYAHCQALYNTRQEARDITTIKALGFELVNPNDPAVDAALAAIPKAETMAWFERYADLCDLVVFRALPDGAIPSGVAKEVEWFRARNKPTIELPSAIGRRTITLDQTREYLREIGQR